MAEVTFDEAPFQELESPPADFGKPEIEATGWFANLSAHIADKPMAFSLAALYEGAGKPKPEAVDLYERFSVWLIPNRVSIIKRGGIAEPVSVGIEVEYRNDEVGIDLNSGMTCSVISLLPTPQFSNMGGISGEIGGNIGFTGDVSLTPALSDFTAGLLDIGSLKVGTHSSLEAHLRFSFSVNVPVVSAVGIGSSRAEWVFTENSKPLYGQDLETWTVLALPKRKKDLTYRIRLYLIMRTAYFRTRRESSWTALNCSLAN